MFEFVTAVVPFGFSLVHIWSDGVRWLHRVPGFRNCRLSRSSAVQAGQLHFDVCLLVPMRVCEDVRVLICPEQCGADSDAQFNQGVSLLGSQENVTSV